MAEKRITFTMDKYSANFQSDNQIEFVNYLLDRIKFWRETATTYKNSLDLIHKFTNKQVDADKPE